MYRRLRQSADFAIVMRAPKFEGPAKTLRYLGPMDRSARSQKTRTLVAIGRAGRTVVGDFGRWAGSADGLLDDAGYRLQTPRRTPARS